MTQVLPTARSIIATKDSEIMQKLGVLINLIFMPQSREYEDFVVRSQRVINFYSEEENELKTEAQLAILAGHDYLIVRVYQ